ncbi:MAG: hypothetical protein PVH50_09385, partial [Anaerolineae bacterium]
MLSKKWSIALAVVVVGSILLSACAQPTPEVIEKEVTKIVEKEGEEVVVTEIVEVTAEPPPAPEKPVTLNWNLAGEPPQVDPA